jgi:hypothetical protein
MAPLQLSLVILMLGACGYICLWWMAKRVVLEVFDMRETALLLVVDPLL